MIANQYKYLGYTTHRIVGAKRSICNINKAKAKKLFVPDKRKVFVQSDYSKF